MAEANHCDVQEYTALIHTVTGIGVHRAITIHHLAEPSLRAVLSLESIHDGFLDELNRDEPTERLPRIYGGLSEIAGTAWIDFPELHKGKDWLERLERNTHLPIVEHPKSKEDFVSVELVVASILHARTKDSPTARGRLPDAHQKYLREVQPDESITCLPPYVMAWLPGFLQMDRPHPPNVAARTDAIRNIASFKN